MPAIQAFDMDHRHWSDVAYHYAVRADGRTFEGRELIHKGAHVNKQNSGKIGIVCMGDYDSGWRSWWTGHGFSGDPIQPPMLQAVKRLSSVLRGAFPITTFGGHMEYGDSETCPGDQLLPVVEKMRAELGLAVPVHRSL